MRKINSLLIIILTSEMAIDLNMLRTVMKDIVVYYLNSTFTVTMERGRSRKVYTHITKEATKPDNFSSGVS